MNANPYEVLGVDYFCDKAEVKAAYHQLAMIHHPDKGGDPEKFKAISAAYAELSSLLKNRCVRKRYKPRYHSDESAILLNLKLTVQQVKQGMTTEMIYFKSHNCGKCSGSGMVDGNDCDFCAGYGFNTIQETIHVTVKGM